MKDLYTFDATQEKALKTYTDVRGAYKALFDELKIPYMTATADSGAMGGSLPGIRRSARHRIKLLFWQVVSGEPFIFDYAKVFLQGRGEQNWRF